MSALIEWWAVAGMMAFMVWVVWRLSQNVAPDSRKPIPARVEWLASAPLT